MTISDDLLCMFTACLDERNVSFSIEVPERELRQGPLTTDQVYRVALLAPSETEPATTTPAESGHRDRRTPPVEEGDMRMVDIESVGNQGDGIAKVERGFVVIVPDTEPGDHVEIEIEDVRENFAIERVIDDWFEMESE